MLLLSCFTLLLLDRVSGTLIDPIAVKWRIDDSEVSVLLIHCRVNSFGNSELILKMQSMIKTKFTLAIVYSSGYSFWPICSLIRLGELRRRARQRLGGPQNNGGALVLSNLLFHATRVNLILLRWSSSR